MCERRRQLELFHNRPRVRFHILRVVVERDGFARIPETIRTGSFRGFQPEPVSSGENFLGFSIQFFVVAESVNHADEAEVAVFNWNLCRGRTNSAAEWFSIRAINDVGHVE